MDASRQSQRVARVYAGAMLLVLAAIAVSALVAGVHALRWLRDVQERALFAAAVLSLGLLVVAAIRLGSQPLPERFAPALTAVAIACAAISIATAALHRAHSFDVGDNSHYVLGAKYARELRYDKHYECVGLAYRELGLSPPKRYRNLRTNETRSLNVAPGSRAERRCQRDFSAARWGQLKRDVALFDSWQRPQDVARRFRDHGYNGTPAWSALAGAVLNAWPLSEHFQTVLGLLNGVWLAAALALVLRAFGWELGLIYVLLFWSNYADRYVLGGAAFRFVPISLLLGGAALWKLARPMGAGVCLGLASALLIFPGLFLAAAGLYFALQLVTSRGRIRALSAEARGAFRVVAIGGATVIASGLLAALYHDGFTVFDDFLRKMSLNSGRLASGRIGFLFNFLWPKSFTAEPTGYGAELQNLHEPLWLGVTLGHQRWLLGCALLVMLARAYARASALSFTLIVGFALFFVGFPTVRYYYMGLVALPLAMHAAPAARSSRLALAAFAAINALCFALHAHAHHAFLHNTLITMGFTAILGALAWPRVAAAVTARPASNAQPARVPPPLGSAAVHRGLASDG